MSKPIVEQIAERRAEVFHERRERLRDEGKRTLPRPKVEQIDGKWWRYTEDYQATPIEEGAPWVHVPAGFVFDGSSVPRVGWFYTAPAGETFRAAGPHDLRFRTHRPDDRAFADREFRQNMLDSGVRATEAWFLWGVLRVFGWFAWRNWQKRQAEVEALAKEHGLEGPVNG